MSDSYECMVCVDRLGRKAQTWTCRHCYHLFHIGCIKKWRKSSLQVSPLLPLSLMLIFIMYDDNDLILVSFRALLCNT